MSIKAVTFDLWDTVIEDDSDEVERGQRGLDSKRVTRRKLAHAAYREHADVDRRTFEVAYDVMEAAFNHVWHDQHVTWTVAERLAVLDRGLGVSLSDPARAELVRALEEMEIGVAPRPVAHIGEAIEALAGEFELGVVSDAIYSPGRCLRRWLEMHGFLHHFGAFAFSDEIGHSKPHRDMFAAVADGLGVAIDEMLHVGDRDHNDVKGPHALGMKAILITASRADDRDVTTADAVCEDPRDLARIVREVAQA